MAIVNKPPNLCIVTELMPNGDLYSFLHKKKHLYQDFDLKKKMKVAL